MGCLSINYSELPLTCRPDDVSCNKDMEVGSFLLALDYVTTGKTDGEVTADQIKKELINNKGELTDSALVKVGSRFNSKNTGITLSAVPFAKDFKAYLKTKHRSVYNNVFGADTKIVVRDNLLDLAAKLEAAADGNPQPYERSCYVVDVYDDDFKLKRSSDPSLVKQMGGEKNAKKAHTLLSEAFSQLPAQTNSCVNPLGNGIVDVSACYRDMAARLRQLVHFLDPSLIILPPNTPIPTTGQVI